MPLRLHLPFPQPPLLLLFLFLLSQQPSGAATVPTRPTVARLRVATAGASARRLALQGRFSARCTARGGRNTEAEVEGRVTPLLHDTSRRFVLQEALRLSSLAATLASGLGGSNLPAAWADVAADSGVQIGIPVGKYLPPSPTNPGRFRFTPAKDSTPSIRGRVLKPYSYVLDLPAEWKAITVGVIQTGDFCQPKCDEPWTEVKFEGKDAGKVKVMMVPTFRLTNTEKPKLEQIGDVDEVIQKIGPFVTGDYYDPEDMPTESKAQLRTPSMFNFA